MGQRSQFAALAVFFLACADPAAPPQSEKPALRSLLARGAAHAEIDQWTEARALFAQASAIDPNEPTTAYDLAVACFRAGDRAEAREHLERARAGAPPELTALLELLRARLAYEDGDEAEEIDAHLDAARLVPDEAAYAHALAQLYLRLGNDEHHGTYVVRAHRLWPENAFLTAEYALWALGQTDDDVRRGGLAVLEPLLTDGGGQMTAYLERGRQEFETLPPGPGARVPKSLRIAVNLLRATQRFQGDATALQARLEPTPLITPVTEKADGPAPSPEIRFEPASLVPGPTLAQGEELIAAVRIDDSTEAPPSGTREAGVALASDRALYVLASDGDAFLRLGEAAPPVRQLLAGDVDDDERMELLLLTGAGPRLWAREGPTDWLEVLLEPELSSADLRRGLLIDFEHDGDLDLLATDGDGALVLATHRGEGGLGAPAPAGLPVDVGVRLLTSADLDADADQDLVLATATELLVMRNWRQGDFAPHARVPLPRGETVARLLTLDADADGNLDVVALVDRGLAFWRGDGQGHLRPDEIAASDTAFFSDKIRPLDLTAADLDLDGDQDLLVAGVGAPPEVSGLVALYNHGGRFLPANDLLTEPWPAARGALILDLDGDRDPDLLSWADAGLLRAFRGSGAEDQRWLALRLRAPSRKVPRDARGVRLQVVAGETVQWLEPGRPNVILGLGRDRPALIKATWPNGISEYLFEPAAETEHVLELSLRVEGSCPFLYASDGDGLRFVTDILGLSPVGMLSPMGGWVPADPEEYVRLPKWVTPRKEGDGTLELAITEELREALYLDQTELVAVDAPADVEVYNGEQWLPAPVEGLQLRLLTPFLPPVSVRDDRGREVLDVVRGRDDRYLRNHSGLNRYQGAVAPHRLTVELPAQVAAAERPALLLVGWLHWGNTSTNVARSQDPDGLPLFPVVEVPDGAGGWRRAAVTAGLPAGKTKPVVVDLTGAVDPGDPRVRLTTDFEVYWDLVATAALRAPEATPHRLHRLAPASAELRWRGFSRWFRPAVDGPYLFDYDDHRDVPWRLDSAGRELVLSWNELEGHYTEFGPVTALLERADDRSVVLGSGEEVALAFDVASLPPVPAGWHRTFFLHSEGWEKDGDPNVSCSRTVEPLPFRGMARDPCSGLVAESAPDASGVSRTRWVGRDRLARRAAALAAGAPNSESALSPR